MLALALGTGCKRGKGGEEKGGEEEPAEEAVPVEVETIKTGPVDDTVFATATLSSERELTLMAGAVGQIVDLEVDEGDTVKEKQVLARIENDELSLAVDRARAQVKRAQSEVDRLEPLGEKGYIPRAELDRAQTELDIAREELKRARAGASDTRVIAPFEGVVALRHVEPNDEVSPAQPVVTIVDPAALKADVKVPERLLKQLSVGQRAEVVAEALGDHTFPAHVEKIAPIVDPATGTIGLEVALDEIDAPGGGHLRPGMFVEVRIVTATRKDVPLVPKRALLFDDTRPYVFLNEREQALRRWIQTGVAAGDRVEVTDGLEPGEEVVVLGQAGLKDETALDILRRDGEPVADARASGGEKDDVGADDR